MFLIRLVLNILTAVALCVAVFFYAVWRSIEGEYVLADLLVDDISSFGQQPGRCGGDW